MSFSRSYLCRLAKTKGKSRGLIRLLLFVVVVVVVVVVLQEAFKPHSRLDKTSLLWGMRVDNGRF